MTYGTRRKSALVPISVYIEATHTERRSTSRHTPVHERYPESICLPCEDSLVEDTGSSTSKALLELHIGIDNAKIEISTREEQLREDHGYTESKVSTHSDY
jgi:hypothetical protein